MGSKVFTSSVTQNLHPAEAIVSGCAVISGENLSQCYKKEGSVEAGGAVNSDIESFNSTALCF